MASSATTSTSATATEYNEGAAAYKDVSYKKDDEVEYVDLSC